MNNRPLGNTGLTVSEIAMGCNRLGEANMPDSHWIRLVHHAIDGGINLFDTSIAYSNGRSEEILGMAVGNREDVIIATKVRVPMPGGARDFSSGTLQREVEGHLRRLQRDCIDVLQLHSPSIDDLQRDDWAEGLDRLTAAGKIRFGGASVNIPAVGLELTEQRQISVLQPTYNIISPEADEELFPRALEKGIGILAKMPYQRGVLTGKFRPGEEISSDHRVTMDSKYLDKNLETTEQIREIGESRPGGMTGLAVQYCLRQTAISAIIPGARTIEQIDANIAAGEAPPLTGEELAIIKEAQRHRWGR